MQNDIAMRTPHTQHISNTQPTPSTPLLFYDALRMSPPWFLLHWINWTENAFGSNQSIAWKKISQQNFHFKNPSKSRNFVREEVQELFGGVWELIKNSKQCAGTGNKQLNAIKETPKCHCAASRSQLATFGCAASGFPIKKRAERNPPRCLFCCLVCALPTKSTISNHTSTKKWPDASLQKDQTP